MSNLGSRQTGDLVAAGLEPLGPSWQWDIANPTCGVQRQAKAESDQRALGAGQTSSQKVSGWGTGESGGRIWARSMDKEKQAPSWGIPCFTSFPLPLHFNEEVTARHHTFYGTEILMYHELLRLYWKGIKPHIVTKVNVLYGHCPCFFLWTKKNF